MTPTFFCISDISNSLSVLSKNFRKIYRLENFRANVLKTPIGFLQISRANHRDRAHPFQPLSLVPRVSLVPEHLLEARTRREQLSGKTVSRHVCLAMCSVFMQVRRTELEVFLFEGELFILITSFSYTLHLGFCCRRCERFYNAHSHFKLHYFSITKPDKTHASESMFSSMLFSLIETQ